MSDNIAGTFFVNNKVGIKSEFFNKIAKELWLWCTSQNMWVSTAHIPGDSFSVRLQWSYWVEIEHSLVSKKCMFGNPILDFFASHINHQFDRYIIFLKNHSNWCLFNQMEQWILLYLSPFQLAWEGESKNLERQNKKHCSDPKMVHATFIPQPLEKRDEKHDRNTISTKNSATLGSTKDLSTTSKASPASAPGQLTKEDIVNVSLRKSAW